MQIWHERWGEEYGGPDGVGPGGCVKYTDKARPRDLLRCPPAAWDACAAPPELASIWTYFPASAGHLACTKAANKACSGRMHARTNWTPQHSPTCCGLAGKSPPAWAACQQPGTDLHCRPLAPAFLSAALAWLQRLQ